MRHSTCEFFKKPNAIVKNMHSMNTGKNIRDHDPFILDFESSPQAYFFEAMVKKRPAAAEGPPKRKIAQKKRAGPRPRQRPNQRPRERPRERPVPRPRRRQKRTTRAKTRQRKKKRSQRKPSLRHCKRKLRSGSTH